MSRSGTWKLICLLMLGLLFGACGESTVSGGPVIVNTAPNALSVGDIAVNFLLQQREVPAAVTRIRFTGLTATGQAAYGPVTFDKAPQIILRGVPVSVTVLQIEYLVGENTIVGYAKIQTVLVIDGRIEVNDPPFDNIPPLSSIQVTPAGPSVVTGQSIQLQATGVSNTGATLDLTAAVTWSSTNPAAATVSSGEKAAGQVLGLAPGTTTVVAELNGATGQTVVTVLPPVTRKLLVTPADPLLAISQQLQLTATALASDGSANDVSSQAGWQSSNPAVASVSATGLVTALAPGTTTITATFDGVSATTTVRVGDVAAINLLLTVPTHMAPGSTAQARATAVFSDGTTADVTAQSQWSTADGTVATVDPNTGLVTGSEEGGTTTLTVQFQGLTREGSLVVSSNYQVRSIPFAFTDISTTGSSVLTSTGVFDDESFLDNEIGFPFVFFGQTYTQFNICSNGFIQFEGESTNFGNESLPNGGTPANCIAPYWDDLIVLEGTDIRTQTVGLSPNRRCIIQWNRIQHFLSSSQAVTFQLVLVEGSNTIEVHFASMVFGDAGEDNGASATVGLQNATSTAGLTSSFETPNSVPNNSALEFY